ncbi:MAG: hypothetical protein LBD53_07400 [Tannerella sp.]|jgi:hypothetical protein|nr:hypothetical protein [Tannerella sp.]
MKSFCTYLLVVPMTALVLYGGAGVNVIRYCCDNCRQIGIESVSAMECCAHENSTCKALSPAGLKSSEIVKKHCSNGEIPSSRKNCCSFEHITFDWNSHQALKQIIDPIFVTFFADKTSALLINISIIGKAAETVMNTGPPVTPPRDYLAILTVLLI